MLGRTRALLRAAAAPGPYSRMMDMGGAPGATGPAKKFDLGKNNKIRAVALDFHLLTGSLSGGDDEAAAAAAEAAAAAASASVPPLPPAQPDTGVVEDLAGILGVELGGTMGRRRRGGEMEGDGDDLTGLAGDGPAGAAPPRGRRSALLDSRPPPPPGFDPQESELGASIFGALKRWGGAEPEPGTGAGEAKAKVPVPAQVGSDIRSKYAGKLRDRLDGGLAGVENAKAQVEEALSRGDAAGHLAARKIASAQRVGKKGTKWLATTGTGNLLQYLSSRSMRIALLPIPNNANGDSNAAVSDRMDLLTRQMPEVNFGLLVKDGNQSPSDILDLVKAKTEVPNGSALVVSDRDDYLREAKDSGYYTCRIRPKNSPSGNVTTNYTVEDIAGVQDVINELNGISYNTVFASVGIDYGGV